MTKPRKPTKPTRTGERAPSPDVVVNITDLRPDTRNANAGTVRGLAMLEDSIGKYGAGRGILADKHGNIIAGNKTLQAAVDAGLKVKVVQTDGRELVVTQRTDLDLYTDTKARELAYADNRVAEIDLAWNAEALLADLNAGVDLSAMFDGDELAAILASVGGDDLPGDPGPQIDKAAELQKVWNVKRGDLWTIGAHRLLCGDSTDPADVARVMGGEKAEMMWTDPPYGVSVGDKNKMLNAIAPSNRVEENLTNDTLDEPELKAMLCAAFDNAMEHCTAGAAWYVAAPAGPLHVIFGQVLKDRGIWRQTIQWVKNNATFAPLGVDYHWRAEPIFYGWVPNAAHRYHGGRTQDTVWEIDRPLASPEHPTMKPVELVTRAIGNSSNRGLVVYDPFSGSGTTLVACEQTHRRGRAIEIEPKYVAVALDRLQRMGLSPEREA